MIRNPTQAALSVALCVLAGLGACNDSKPGDYYRLPRVRAVPNGDVPRSPAPDVQAAPDRLVEPEVGPGPTDALPLGPEGRPDGGAAAPDVIVGPDVLDSDVLDTDVLDTEDEATAPNDRPLPVFVELFRKLSPSVVNIYTQEVVERRLFDPLRDSDAERIGTSLGSGMILDEDGYILTNAHVVENAAEIRVRFADETELPARLVGIDPVRDMALLKVDGARGLVPVVPGDSDALRVGDWILAIGNPFGLSHTLTKGIVSATGRAELITRDSGYADLIQTDAAINPGNSGGPLFNLDGEVVGVATAVSARGYGIGFAIPWSAVERALPRLKQGGQVSRSWLGVYVRASAEPSVSGLLVVAVVDESPAERAGIAPGDLLISYDGRALKDTAAFRLMVASSPAERDVPIVVARGGRRLEVKARLEEARGVR